MINKILLIGAGNVATNLGLQLKESGFEIVGCYSSTIDSSGRLANTLHTLNLHDLQHLPNHELILICVPDDKIFSVLVQLPEDSKIAYTSGTISLQTLRPYPNLGVFYPLQTFTKEKIIDLKTVPFFIEANNSQFENELYELAKNIGKQATVANSEQRKQLHIAAVFVNNFTNHLAYLAKNHLEKHQLSWENLLPLFEETFVKIMESNPKDVQTGPAKRNDIGVIHTHLTELSEETKKVYKAITDSIIHTYHAKL